MSPNHGDLLAASNQVNARIAASENSPRPDVKVATPPKVQDLKLVDEDVDPFNGNLNNRRVAERIAQTPGGVKQFLNNSLPSHIGDPTKAAADVAKSKSIIPDPHGAPGEVLAQAPTKEEMAKTDAAVRNRQRRGPATPVNEPPSIGAGAAGGAASPEWKPQG